MMWWWTVGAAFAGPELDAVVRALSSRDPVSCETVEALTPTPRETLLEVVEQVSMPPWAPMKAADCLVRNHPLDVIPQMEAWVTDPNLLGLGRLVLGRIDQMPVEAALPVARKALVGSDPELARARVGAAAAPELSTLVPVTTAPVAP